MSVLLKTKLEVLLKDTSASLDVSGFHEEIARAFLAIGSCDDRELPSPACAICDGRAFVSQPLKGSARFFLIKCKEKSSSAPNITIEALIYADEEDPKPEVCVREFCGRTRKAGAQTDKLCIQVQQEFYVYPLIDGALSLPDGSPFYFVAKREPRFTPEKIRRVVLVFMIGVACYVVGFLLQAMHRYEILSGILLNLVAGAVVGVGVTLLYELLTGRETVSVGLNDAVSREAERMRSSRTAATIAEYKEATPILRRGGKAKGDEQ